MYRDIEDNMNIKAFRLLILSMVFFASSSKFAAGVASSVSDGGSVSKNEASISLVDEYFKEFSEKAKIDHVKYMDETNELILFAYPSKLNDFGLALFSIVALGVAGIWGLAVATTNDYSMKVIRGLISGGCLVGTLAACLKIIKNYKMRNGFIPYLTFDSKGLKRFDGYVLEWKNIVSCPETNIVNRAYDMYGNVISERLHTALCGQIWRCV